MLHISYGWTWPALFAPTHFQKIVTRRSWKDSHAKKFKKGMVVKAIDKDFRAGGKEIGKVKILEAPYKQPLSEMTIKDYFHEGFAFMNLHSELVPKSMKIGVDIAGFNQWKKSGESMYVVHYEILELIERPFKLKEVEDAICLGCCQRQEELTTDLFPRNWMAVDYTHNVGVCSGCKEYLPRLEGLYGEEGMFLEGRLTTQL